MGDGEDYLAPLIKSYLSGKTYRRIKTGHHFVGHENPAVRFCPRFRGAEGDLWQVDEQTKEAAVPAPPDQARGSGLNSTGGSLLGSLFADDLKT